MIYLTGSSGFVGNSIVNYFNTKDITKYKRGFDFKIGSSFSVIHLAGKAHDIKKETNSDEYYKVNTEFTKEVFNAFLDSSAKVFITLSSVKAVADNINEELFEDVSPNPTTHYGKSKLLAEQYILLQPIPEGKRVYILRPCLIHGPGNKGNLNLLHNLVSKGLPWPLGLFKNSRSYLSIENLCFVLKELIEREDIPSGVYNVADDFPLSTNDLIKIIAETKGKKTCILNLSKNFIKLLARVGDFFKLPLNSERLEKLTESYVVSNTKLKKALRKPLPISSKDGLIRTFQSFTKNI